MNKKSDRKLDPVIIDLDVTDKELLKIYKDIEKCIPKKKTTGEKFKETVNRHLKIIKKILESDNR